MLDDDRWKAVTTVGYLAHPETLKHRPCRSHAVNVTMPREAMFVTKTLEDPLRRVPLLAVNRAILFQNAVDDIRERRQLRALRRLASPISRRFRMQQYLGNRLAVDPELARSFPSAQTLTMTRQSHSSIKIHSVHPPPSIRSILTKAIDGPILVRRRNRTNRPLHWGIIAPPFSQRMRSPRHPRVPHDRRQLHTRGMATRSSHRIDGFRRLPTTFKTRPLEPLVVYTWVEGHYM